MALSLTVHGLAILPLFLIAGTLGSTSQEPALIVEFAVAAPAVGDTAEPDGALADLPLPDEPPPPTAAEMTPQSSEQPPVAETPPPEAAAEIAVDLPLPDDPPPLNVTDLKPVEPPKPKPAPTPRPAAPRPAAKPAAAARAATTPDTGTAAATQQATAAPTDAIVFEGRPRYRVPPKPAVYPARAIELGQQGEVLIRVRLDLDGSAAEIRLWRSSGVESLDQSALAAVRGWLFHPAIRGGHPVMAWVEIPVRFHLR